MLSHGVGTNLTCSPGVANSLTRTPWCSLKRRHTLANNGVRRVPADCPFLAFEKAVIDRVFTVSEVITLL